MVATMQGEGVVIHRFQLTDLQRKDSLADRNALLHPGDLVHVRVYRGDSHGSTYTEYDVPYAPRMRVLEVLQYISSHQEPNLAYRWICGSKMCGTCGIRMNGREVLACWEAVLPSMTLEPLRNLPVIRDLVVDRGPYEDRVASYEPWVERARPYADFPEHLDSAQMARMSLASEALTCISCMACFSACPVIGLGDLTKFSGPAPLVQAAQTVLDPRTSDQKRDTTLGELEVFSCVSCYKCEEVCPAHIHIVSHVIEPLKRLVAKKYPWRARHSLSFERIVRRRGWINPSELVLRTRGLRALSNPGRVLQLIAHHKISLRKLLFGWWGRNAACRLIDIGRNKL